MRDVVAAIVAVVLLVVAASLATTLQTYRRRRQRARDSERALGRTIIAELPTSDDLVLISEDDKRFYYGDRAMDKDLIVAVRVLINRSPIAAYVSRRHARHTPPSVTAERGEGVPAKPDRGVGAPGVINERGEGVPAKPDRGGGAPGVINDQGIGVPGEIEARPEGFARDRWDVAIETVAGTTLIECGAIRERVSQELARAVFEAVKDDLEQRDRTATETQST